MFAAVVIVGLVVPASSPVKADPPSPQGRDCSYAAAAADGAGAREWLPDGGLFRPLLADAKEPRFSASYRRVDFVGRAVPSNGHPSINGAMVSLGSSIGIYRWTGASCDGLQIGATGAVFSMFNLDGPSQDLVNSDFLVGFPLELRLGELSARLRLLHQSSHLGDEFVLNNPETERVDLQFEWIDALLSYELALGQLEARVYGGGGYLLATGTPLDRSLLQAGAELASADGARPSNGEVSARAVLGADVNLNAERDWGATASFKAGLELASSAGRRVRLLLVYLEGYMPSGQFFTEEIVRNYGVELQIEP